MVLLHIAHIETTVVGGVNIAVPNMVNTQMNFATVGMVNLTGEAVGNAPNFSLEDVLSQNLPAPFDQPDLVVFHEVYRPAFLKLARFFMGKKIPYIVIPHGCLSKTAQQKKWLKKRTANLLLFRSFLKNACMIQYLSPKEQSESAFSYPSVVLPNGIAVPPVKKEPSANKAVKLLYIGRLEWHIKGFDLMFEAVHLQKELLRTHNVTLSIHGPNEDSSREELKKLIDRYEISDIVHLQGEVWGEEKTQAFLAADYFIQTSRSEGMPMGLLEAMAHGLPVIVTEGTGFSDIATECQCGFGCKGDSKEIALAIQKAVLQTDNYALLSQNARALTEKHYEEQAVSQKTVCSYQSLLS